VDGCLCFSNPLAGSKGLAGIVGTGLSLCGFVCYLGRDIGGGMERVLLPTTGSVA
jgi:hypothetical protein